MSGGPSAEDLIGDDAVALLVDALECMSDGAVLLDPELRIVLVNSAFKSSIRELDDLLAPGTPFAEVLEAAIERGVIEQHGDDVEGYILRRLWAIRDSSSEEVQVTPCGRVYGVRSFPAANGGFFLVRRDITELQQAESSALRAFRWLEDAFESIDGGVILYDADECMVLCNERIREYFQRMADVLIPGVRFEEVARAAFRTGYVTGYDNEEEYVRDRLRSFRNNDNALIWHGDPPKCHDHRQYRTSDGGTLIIRYDVTDLRRAEWLAEQASRAKSEFLSSVSHEVRTPLNGVLGFASILREELGASIDERQRGYLDNIVQCGEYLLALIDQVLELANADAGTIEIDWVMTDVAVIVGDAIDTLEPLRRGRGVKIIRKFPTERSVQVQTDPVRLSQIALNLISNAIKYNCESGRVWVTLEQQEGGGIVLTVADEGVGIPPARVESLFQPFNRLGREASGVEGTGIGLAISRRLAEALGGDIEYHPREGGGAAFVLRIDRPRGHRASTITPASGPRNSSG